MRFICSVEGNLEGVMREFVTSMPRRIMCGARRVLPVAWFTVVIIGSTGGTATAATERAASDPTLRSGLRDYRAGHFPEALRKFNRAALHGNRIAEFNYAMMLLDGEGTPPDQTQALVWLQKAAEANMSHAQYAYGRLFDDGRLVKLDPARAHGWYLKAANQGHVLAEVALGSQYMDGRGVPRDYAKAFTWYHKAAKAGDQASQYIVGSYYERGGDGVKQNLLLARLWYAEAAAQGGDPASLAKVHEMTDRLDAMRRQRAGTAGQPASAVAE